MKNSDFPSVQSVMDDLTGRTGQKAASVEPTPEQRGREARCAVATGSHPPAPDRFDMGDKRRFHLRQYNERYEVYSVGLDQWAECDTPEHAATVAEALEAFYANIST